MSRITQFTCSIAWLVVGLLLTASAPAQVANIKVVTDANPDYSDMESMVRSITSNWKTDAEKMYALFYWDHIARRQTVPMELHGYEMTDPIRQYNDYGFTMCSTITGIKCSEWTYLGYPCRMFDISEHTVPDVWYEGKFHHYDNSLSVMYTLPDGKTIASIEDIGKTMAGPETDGKEVPGYIAMYHCLNGTSLNGWLEGADTDRSLQHMGQYCFNPHSLKYRYYYYNYERGYRYILNLRDGETYTRYYARQDANSPDAVALDAANKADFKSDPAYYVPNGKTEDGKPRDPELPNPRYHIRGNGERVFVPVLDADHLLEEVYSTANIKALQPGLEPQTAGQPGVVIFKVEGANVITSMKIHAALNTATANDSASIAISTTNGLQWTDHWKNTQVGDETADLTLLDAVNGAYEVLVKVTLNAKAKPEDAVLKSIQFDTITELNGKTQPQLKLGANTVYVGTGEQTESIVLWPELRDDRYKTYAVEEKNIEAAYDTDMSVPEGKAKFLGYTGNLFPGKDGDQGYVVFKVDAPTDLTSITYGGRLYNRGDHAHIDFLHSFDGGKTWKQDYSLTDNHAPWDVIHYETVNDVPAGTRSVLFKYAMNCSSNEKQTGCSIYEVRMEVDHKLAAPSTEPMEVTFDWSERQKDYSVVKRSHTQLVEKYPFTYTIDVGGYDQPIVNSLTINLKGARGDLKYGYSDGKDVGGKKWVGQWATYGNDLALNKPYTVSVPSETDWGAGDPDGKKLTDGVVGSSYTGGVNMKVGPLWHRDSHPEIVVDLGQPQKCAAFRIHTLGYEFWDAMKGEIKDKVEVLTSMDGKDYKSAGFFDFNLHWKDLPVNFMYPDDETICAHNFMLPLAEPMEARYVKYKLTPARYLEVTQVEVLDGYKFEPFDLKIALPDRASNGKAPPKADVSPNARTWTADELPTTIGKPLKDE